MAELTTDEKITIAGILAPAFSARRTKAFHLPADHEAAAEEGRCDFVLRAGDGELAKFEHTRPKSENELERVKPDHARQVAGLLGECLKQRGIREITVALILDPPPRTTRERRRLASWLCDFVAKKVRDGRLAYFALDVPDDWNGYLALVQEWLASISVTPGPAGQEAVVFASGSRMGHEVNSVARFKEAVKRKSVKCAGSAPGLVLLVEFDPFPISTIFLSDLRDAAREMAPRFKEIWVLNNYVGDQRCWCIWPIRKGEHRRGWR